MPPEEKDDPVLKVNPGDSRPLERSIRYRIDESAQEIQRKGEDHPLPSEREEGGGSDEG